MQAPAVVETASGRGHHGNGGSGPKDEPSNPKKENVLSSDGCNEARLTFLNDWDFLAPKQRTNDKKINTTKKIDSQVPSFSASRGTNTECLHGPSDASENSIDCASLNETFFTYYSDSELKNENLLDLEFDSEMQKREEVFFDILEHQGNKIVGLERIFNISDDDYKETAEDTRKRDKHEDLEQEYYIAEEPESLWNHLPLDQTKTSTVANLEVVGLRNSGYEVNSVSSLEVNHVELQNTSCNSLDSADVCGQQDESPLISKFQNSFMLTEYREPEHEKYKEQETSLMYHTASDEIVLSSLPENQGYQSITGFLNPQKALKTEIYPGKIKSQVTETKDFCGNAKIGNRMLHLEDPSTSPQLSGIETSLRPYKEYQTSWTSVFDDSLISASGYSRYKSLRNIPNPSLDFSLALSRTGFKDNQAIKEGSSLDDANAGTTNKCFHNVEGTCPESVTGAAQCSATVNQTVDVSTDFRVCFTTSKATSARSSVVSTSSNTEITMMNKKRPGEWLCEQQTRMACDADWSSGQDNEDTQVAVTKASPGKSLSDGSFKPNGSFLNKDSLELRKTAAIAELREKPERETPLCKEVEKILPLECCQKTMQRAIKAEMHLLNVQFQMCCRHCIDTYKLVMESREGLNRNLSSNSKKQLGSALLSVLGDLKVRYVNLKEKINKGIPLEELPPLSVESKLLSTFSTFASRLMKKEPHVFSGADSALDNQSTCDVDVSSSLKLTLSQMSLSSDTSHPNQGTSPKEAGLKNGDIDVYFSQLKLDDKDCKNYQEISEDWFDAEEHLTGVDFSGIQGNPIEPSSEDPEGTPEKESGEPLRRDKAHFIHVGGLCPSVSEADLRSHFQKYQVSEISIYDSSTNYRYASLAFKKNSDAKMAVKEMNGIEINGKSVNVRLVKTGEHISSLSSKNGHRVSVNNLEKRTSKEANSASFISRLPRTRPRQLGSEQDCEVLHSDQKCVKKNCKQIESTKSLPYTPVQFIPPNTLNLRSFTKVVKRVAELHPKVSRDRIIGALQEVRISHDGFLNGLAINTIVEMTSSVLKNSASS